MKHGEETVNEIGQFIKERLAMEEEYGKMFTKSINRVCGVFCCTFFTFIIQDIRCYLILLLH